MFKKTLATAVLVATMPAMAHAWQILTTARTTGGTLSSTANGSQAAAAGTKTKSYWDTNLVAQTINAAADAGYVLKSVIVTDLSMDPATRKTVKTITNVTAQLPYVLNPVAAHTYTVNAAFTVNAVAVTASNPNGIVSPARVNGLAVGTVLTKDVVFTFTPNKGFSITGINGIPTGATSSVPGGADQPATVTLPTGFTVAGPIALAATTANSAGIDPIAPASATAGASKSITATVTGVASPVYAWKFLNGPAAVGALTGADTATVTFTAPATAGQYIFQVSESTSGTSQYAVVNVSSITANNSCQFCHTANGVADSTIGARYAKSIHSQSTHSSCNACHFQGASHSGTVNNGSVTPGSFVVTADGVANGSSTSAPKGTVFCASCHKGGYGPAHGIPFASTANPSLNGTACAACHASGASKDAHDIVNVGCVDCHSVPKAAIAGLVNDNNGVRAIAGEFQKWSHHVVNPNGMAVQEEQCGVCHLEGTVVGGKFVIDETKHMADAVIHLRNAQTDADMQWDPANPNHTTMDNFCMTCHSANGATSTIAGELRTLISAKTGITGSATNPFCDTISNRYDKMMRPAVTNVDAQFNTANNSHHGVKGPRYSGRTRFGSSRVVASTFASNSSATLQGIRSTMYDAGNFNDLYVPLADATGEAAPRTGAQGLGDDSTLHCGDCHTVGQWKVGSSKNADGSATPVAIGAHGSNNEYMLRNTQGTDERHVGVAYSVNANNVVTVANPTAGLLVCYNCHSFNKYGSVFIGTGADAGNPAGAEMGNVQPHAGEYASAGRCNGPGNTLSFNGYTTLGADGFDKRFISQPTPADKAAGYQSPDFGNIFGIQCLNCHNSGAGNAYGGIHGSANDTNWATANTQTILAANAINPTTKGFYIDGMGNVNSVQRFLPGLGNVAHVPGTLGGFVGGTSIFRNGSTASSGSIISGGVSKDTNWEQKHWQQKSTTVINFKTAAVSSTASAGAGCYTLGTKPAAVAKNYEGASVTGQGGAATELLDVWGGCEDHGATKGMGDHGFLKRIVRPITY